MITDNIQSDNSYPKNFKHENCPVCGELDSRCKPIYADAIYCWNTSAADLNSEWYLIKEIGGGMRGVMVSPRRGYNDSEDSSDISQMKRDRAAAERLAGLAQLPTNEIRDRGYRTILAQTTLSQAHRNRLKRRGLTDDQINFSVELGWFTTWEKGLDLTENIAGYDPATNQTRWLGGMFVSTINQFGEIVGGQIAADNAEQVGKYFWVSSVKVGGYGCQLQHTGELPLYVRKHPDCDLTAIELWLCEGGVKSAVTALKMWESNKNIIVVGTAMSAKFTKELDEIIKDLKPLTVCILPDAGAVNNPEVLSGVLMTSEQVRHCEYLPLFGWWEQETKLGSFDIDDYLVVSGGNISTIEWLTLQEFAKIYDKNKRLEVSEVNEPNEAKIPSEDLPEFLKNAAYSSYKTSCLWDEPDISKPGNLITRQEKLATDWKNKDDNAIGWELFPPRKGEILFLKAGTGSGKSFLIANWMNGIFKERGCIFLGYRNGLLHQQCDGVTDLQHLRGAESDGFMRLLDPNYRVAFCDASLHNMRASMASGKILVIDEVVSVLMSILLGSTCSRGRRNRLNTFAGMLQEADMIVCLDAHLSNWCAELLMSLAQNKTLRKMENVWEGKPRQVKMYTGTLTNPSDKTAIRTEIINSAAVKPIAVFSDSQHELESLHELMLKTGINPLAIARIDSKTSGEPWCIECLSNVDKYLENHPEITILFVSPSGDSGLDLSSKYFQHVFLILCGTLTINSALQMYGRVRDRDVPRSIFVTQDAKYRLESGGETLASVKLEMRLCIENQLKLITEGVTTDSQKEAIFAAVNYWQSREKLDLYTDTIGTLIAKTNFEKMYYREMFVDRLLEMKDDVTLVTADGDSQIKEEFSLSSLDVKYAEATKLVNADEISAIEAESYRRKDRNLEQGLALRKFDFMARMPGVLLTVDLAKTLLYDPSFLQGLEQRYYCFNPEIAKAMNRLKWGGALTFSGYFTSDFRLRLHERTDCLQKLGVTEFLDDRDWLENGTEIRVIRKRWDKLKAEYGHRLAGIMGFDFNYKEPILTVYKMLALVGCDLRMIKNKKRQKNEPKIRRITYGSLHDPLRTQILESFPRRFDGLKTVNWEEVENVCKTEIETKLEIIAN
jgi:hypothetical protein